MAYATITDVQQRMPQFQLTAASRPTLGDAERMLADVEAELDASLSSLGYVVPIVANANSLLILRAWASECTIARILTARAAAVGGDPAVQSAERAEQRCQDRYKRLADPKDPFELDSPRTDDAVPKPNSDLAPAGKGDWPRATMDQEF